MHFSRLIEVVTHNANRNRKQFALSAFGIVVGIAAFVFFLGLSTGVRNVVLGEMFPIEQVEVVAPRTTLLGMSSRSTLDDSIVEKIAAQPGVKAVVPRLQIAFPAAGRATIAYGGRVNRIGFEVLGDGIRGSYVEEKYRHKFKDWETPEELAKAEACPAPAYRCDDEDYYCDRRDQKCHHKVPMIVSRYLLEIYNSQFAESRGMPIIDSGLGEVVVQRLLRKIGMDIYLGQSTVAAANKNLSAPPRRLEAQVIGLSDAAIRIGATVPIEYVQRWNRDYISEAAASEYSSIIVELEDKDDVAAFGAWVSGVLKLKLTDSVGEQFALVILIITLLLVLISMVIVVISAINIAHNFFMQVSERRREIGVLRAIGASSRDVRSIILGEAALIGLVAGVAGIVVALGVGWLVDFAAARYLPDFPFKPETFFDFRWWILSGGMVFSVLFCVVGGYLPARRASRMAPAQALSVQ